MSIQVVHPINTMTLGAFTGGVAGTPTFSTDPVLIRGGGGDTLIEMAAVNVNTNVQTLHTGQRVIVESFFICVHVTPTNQHSVWAGICASGNATLQLTTSNTLRAQMGAGVAGTASDGLVIDQWYRIDVSVDTSGATATMNWALNGTPESPSSVAQVAADITTTQIGYVSSVGTCTVRFMDWVTSYTSGDYMLGAYGCFRHLLNGCGTHNLPVTPSVFQKTGGIGIIAGETTSFQDIDEIPVDNTNWVYQTANDTTYYVEYTFADSLQTTDPKCVAVFAAYQGALTGTYSFEVHPYDGTQGGNIILGALASTTLRYSVGQLPAAPSGAWTLAYLNALRVRFGFASDTNPNPQLVSVCAIAAHAQPFTPPPPPGGPWVAPLLVQKGTFLKDSNNNPVTLRGVIYDVPKPDPTLNYTYLPTLFPGANLLNVHTQWSGLEPTRPQGGDPTSLTNLGTRDFLSSGNMNELDTVLDWCDAHNIYAIINLSSTGRGAYFAVASGGKGHGGFPSWLFDDTLWQGNDVSIHQAPLPANRAGYGGAYPPLDAFVHDADTAAWTFNSDFATSPPSGSNKMWGGDADTLAAYMLPVIEELMFVGQNHPCVVGYKLFNETDPGYLVNNFGAVPAVTKMLTVQKNLYFDTLRATEPSRFFLFCGRGGETQQGSDQRFDTLWGGGGGPCPSDHHFVEEIHWYSTGGVNQLLSPYDSFAPSTTDNNSQLTTYPPPGASIPNMSVAVDAWFNLASTRNVPILFGEWGIHASVTGSAQLVIDEDNAFRRHSISSSYFGLNKSKGLGLLTISGTNVSLNSTTGPQLAAQFQIPYTTRPVGIDSGTGTDASALKTKLPQTDSGTGTDATSARKLAAFDSGLGGNAATLHAVMSQPDSGAGSNASTEKALVVRPDSGSGAELSLAQKGPGIFTSSDPGFTQETIPGFVSVRVDAGAGTDIAHSLRARTDTGTGSDASTLHVSHVRPETGTESEASTLKTVTVRPDQGAGIDASAITIKLTKTDSGHGTDRSKFLGVKLHNHKDPGVGTDVSFVAFRSTLDVAAGTDVAILNNFKSVTDSGGITDETSTILLNHLNVFMIRDDSGHATNTSSTSARYLSTEAPRAHVKSIFFIKVKGHLYKDHRIVIGAGRPFAKETFKQVKQP